MTTKTDDKVSFTLELSTDANAKLDALATKTKTSKGDVLRRALLLLGVTLDERDKGHRVAITDGALNPLQEVIVL